MQQINLYLPELRPSKEWLTADTLAFSVLGFIGLLFIYSALLRGDIQEFEASVVELENQKKAMSERVEKIKSIPRLSDATQLDERIQRLRQSISSRERVGKIIENQSLGNSLGFSAAMKSLARKSKPTVSLAHIRLSMGGNLLEISGNTKRAEDIATYIQDLQNEESFRQSKFGLVSVIKSETRTSLHKFSMGFENVYQLVAKEGLQ